MNRSELNEVATKVLATIPRPFGTFEKTKYMLCNTHSKNIYSFVTTVHNTEEAIELLKGIAEKRMENQLRYYQIYKVQNGIRKIIYTDKPFDKP